MLKKMILLPGTLATALVIGGCEEGDFEGDLGEPDVQTETQVIEPETGAAPPADSPEMQQESEFQLDQPSDAESGQLDASTSDPVEVQQDVNVPEQQGQQGQQGQANQQQSGQQQEQTGGDADAVEEVPADSLPGDNQSGNQGSGNQGSGSGQ